MSTAGGLSIIGSGEEGIWEAGGVGGWEENLN